MKKVYPPNTTLVANLATECAELHVFGDITKFVLEENKGKLHLGDGSMYIEDVVISQVSGRGKAIIWSQVGNLEVRYLKDNAYVQVRNPVKSHVDIKRIEYDA